MKSPKPAIPIPAAPAGQCLTHEQRVKLVALTTADRAIMNKQSRLAIERAVTQQNIAEFHQQLSDLYGVKDGDTIDHITGKITRKG